MLDYHMGRAGFDIVLFFKPERRRYEEPAQLNDQRDLYPIQDRLDEANDTPRTRPPYLGTSP